MLVLLVEFLGQRQFLMNPTTCSHLVRPRSSWVSATARLLTFTILTLAGLIWDSSLQAAMTVSASKDCTTSPATVTEGSFTIATAQVVAWSALYNPVGSCNGDAFYLSQTDASHADIPLTTSGALGGTQFLNAGTYHISIRTFLMGSGSYSVTFNRTATIGASPTSHDFGSQLEGVSTAATTFHLTKTGDLDITGITATVESGAPFFEIVTPPATNAPTSFTVKFNAGTISGSQTSVAHAGTIRVKASSNPSGVTVPDVIINVSGTTLKKQPKLKYDGTVPTSVHANYVTGEHADFQVKFENDGTADLTFSSPIQLVNDNPENVFTEVTPAATSPLPGGAARSEQVRFTPPATAAQDQVYKGHIQIFSNDPANPSLRCDFTATAHEPRPVIRVEPMSGVLNYHDVEIGYAYDLPIIVHNDGDAPLVFDVTDVDPANPAHAQWESLSTPIGTTIAAGGAASVLVQRFKPVAVGGPYTLTLGVHGTNHPSLPPPMNITLTGKGTAPVAVNSVLLLDRSGSMDESAGPTTKMGALRIAGEMWADLLRPETGSGLGDAVGLVRYNKDNQEYVSLALLTTAQLGAVDTAFEPAAITDLNRLKPDGTTGIGGAMQRGAGMLLNNLLEPANANVRKHVMVVMTDGIENEQPWINDVLPTITAADSRLHIYSLGLGNDLDLGKLQSITNRANGFHQVTGDLTGTARFDLQTFYFKILVDTLEWQMVVDPTYAVDLSANNTQVVSIAHVCSSDLAAMFVVMDEPSLRGFYDLQLLDPNGNLMSLGASVGGVPVQVIERENYRILKVVFPDISLSSSYVGDWKLLLVPNGKWKPRGQSPRNNAVGNQANGDPIFNGYNGLVPIGFGAAVGSNYRLDAQVSASAYQPNADITMTASLSDRQWPSVTGSVTVDVTTPNGTTVPGVVLYDDGTHGDVAAGDGTWTNHFGQTSQSGSYKFFFTAIGHNDRGELAPRQATKYVSLVPPDTGNPNGNNGNGTNGNGGSGDGRGCLSCAQIRWLWTVAIALLVLILLLLLRRKP